MNSVIARDTRISLLVLLGVILFVCAGLAADGNWPKLLRVSSAFSAYAGALVLLGALRSRAGSIAGFAAAGALAGLVSGLVRPELDVALVPVSVAGGIAFALTHRLGLTRWRSLAADRVVSR